MPDNSRDSTRNFLTHKRGPETGRDAPPKSPKTSQTPKVPETSGSGELHESSQTREPAPFPDAPVMLEAQSIQKPQIHDAALSGKMARISSLRDSGGPVPEKKPDSGRMDAGVSSSLPTAMARLHRKHQENELREKLKGHPPGGKAADKTSESADLRMDDPEPGSGKAFFWFFFRFGRFAKGVLLAQPLSLTLLFWILCGLGTLQLSVKWLSPPPGPGGIYNQLFASRVLAGGLLLGMAGYLSLSMLLFLILRKKYGGIAPVFGFKVVVSAFLPLALGQLMALVYGTLMIGEPFWRGNVPDGIVFFSKWVLPALWIWGGYRTSQAVTGLISMKLSSRIWLKSAVTLALGLPVLLPATGWLEYRSRRFDREWELFRKEAQTVSSPVPRERFSEIEAQLPFHDTRRRRDFYLYRMQTLYRQDRLDEARADALRLDRMALAGSADDQLAKGLNYFFHNRLDLALPRLESAIALDPNCLPAYQWLALARVGSDIEAAEEHARVLMRNDPNVFHMQLLVRILFLQEKYRDIWDVMLTVDAPPDQWDPLTLEQGGIAAEKIGYPQRAETLRALSRRTSESAGE